MSVVGVEAMVWKKWRRETRWKWSSGWILLSLSIETTAENGDKNNEITNEEKGIRYQSSAQIRLEPKASSGRKPEEEEDEDEDQISCIQMWWM